MLNWFKRKQAESPPRDSATEAVHENGAGWVDAGSAGAPEPALPTATPPPTGATLAAAHARLQGLVGERARAILARLERKSFADDVRQLLDVVLNSEEATIRPIPTAAKRAMALARNPDSSLGEIAEAFERDPSLAEALLRLANSAWYRGDDGEVDSLRDALQRTGCSGAEVVIMERALKATLCRPGGAYDAMVADVWLHLSRTAGFARSLARLFGLEPETAFLLGLLHDAGKLVLFDAISQLRHRTHRGTRMPYPVLKELLAELHEPLGGLAILHWGLGVERARAVADHHRRGRPRVADAVSELLYVAERADLALLDGQPCDPAQWIAEGGLAIGVTALRRALAEATEGALRIDEADDRGGLARAA